MALFPKLENRVGEISLARAVHELSGGQSRVRTHAHVEGSGQTETESTLGVFKLQRTYAKVCDDTRSGRQAALSVQRSDLCEVPFHNHQLLAVFFQPFAGPSERRRVAVKPQKLAAPEALEDFLRVAARAERRVNVGSIGPNLQKLQNLFD